MRRTRSTSFITATMSSSQNPQTRYHAEPWIDARHGPTNQLGAAVQLALRRHLGFGLRAGETVPSPVLGFLADQIHAPVTALFDRLTHHGDIVGTGNDSYRVRNRS